MTHGIQEDDYSSYYSAPQLSAEESLLIQLRKHLSHVSQYSDEKHIHKRNVLAVAIELLEGTKTFEDLHEAIQNNSCYNKAIFPSETEQFVNRAISLAPAQDASENPTLSAPQMKLILLLESQLSAVAGKKGEKHEDKVAVLKAAIDLLKGKSDKETLEQVKREHPRYNEAFFTSKTEQLVNKAIVLAPQSQKGMRP